MTPEKLKQFDECLHDTRNDIAYRGKMLELLDWCKEAHKALEAAKVEHSGDFCDKDGCRCAAVPHNAALEIILEYNGSA